MSPLSPLFEPAGQVAGDGAFAAVRDEGCPRLAHKRPKRHSGGVSGTLKCGDSTTALLPTPSLPLQPAVAIAQADDGPLGPGSCG